MAYTRTTWVDGSAPALNAANLNNIEAGLVTLDTDKAPLASPTFTGTVATAASTATVAGFSLPHGTAPSTPVNGDLWTTTAGIYVRINGTTVGPLGSGGGGGTWGSINGTLSSQTDLQSTLDLKAPLASPIFTGTVTAPTIVGTDATDASSSTTGALKTAGGMGVAKSLYVGTDLAVGGQVVVSSVNQFRVGLQHSQTDGVFTSNLDSSNSILMLAGNGTGVAGIVRGYAASGTNASRTAVSNSRAGLTLSGILHNGTGYSTGATITLGTDSSGTVSGTSMPGRISFLTTANGATTATERMSINNAGLVTMNNDLTVSGATTVVSPTAAGSTGVRQITMSTATPGSGDGANGDVWLVYT